MPLLRPEGPVRSASTGAMSIVGRRTHALFCIECKPNVTNFCSLIVVERRLAYGEGDESLMAMMYNCGSRVIGTSAHARETRGRVPPARRADPVRPQRPHPQRRAGRADRRLDPRVRLHQPDPGRRRQRHHRRPRTAARGAQARHDRGAGDRARRHERGAEARLHHRRQQARAERRLGHRDAGDRVRRPRRPRLRSVADRLRRRRACLDHEQRQSGSHRSRRGAGGPEGAGEPSRRRLAARQASAGLRRQHEPR